MSRSKMTAGRFQRLVIVTVIALGTWFYVSACSLGGGACIRMSDCADGFSCVEGTCLSNTGSSSSAATSVASDASPE